MPELGPSPLAAGHELPVDEARRRVLATLRPITDQQTVPLTQALGRVLAEPVVSPIDVPAHDNSAMDGYAFRGADLAASGETRLTALAETVFAGAPTSPAVPPGHAVRIMTGAVMPEGLDTVVPIELCRVDADGVHIAPGVLRPGENRRPQGEDLAQGKPALAAGTVLGPAELGLVASLGIETVPVRRRLRVALFSTGNELRTLGQPLDPGCIYDSNRYSLMAALQRLGVEVLDLGLVPDDPAALNATLDRAIAEADVVLTSGGVSMGDADYTRDLLAARGQVDFWKVAMRPGRPFAFGPLDGPGGRRAWLFALPGNPVAALVTYYVFAREALLVLAGATARPLPALRARSVAAIRKRPGRSEFQRGIVEPAEGGGWQVRLTGAQGAGILRSMAEANALVCLRHDQGSVAAGDEVEVWLFDGLR
ncbi:molybdopterin molybdotransferase MoeA [Ideonella alba]|uniref:Molybdopterin molybdenumtransferase n=1 Tax=Ideonella alba TaxID=2824118 RepID=A0A940YCP2_9BURK|nr:gephyrin-like molybdotransferase Glp [Ideonella alba]MBQ0932215.1 molybdopterin molybdotransferase MoeA [Ideonella alba]